MRFMITNLEQFRNDIYRWFPYRADALMELIDALCSDTTARSVAELSLNHHFRRGYCSIYDAIGHLYPVGVTEITIRAQEDDLIRLLSSHLPKLESPFRLLVTDVTSGPRPYAQTLEDRTFVYQPGAVKGVKPVSIGHQYSMLAVLPDKDSPDDSPWIIPLMINRVTSKEAKRETGLDQITRLMQNPTLPFRDELCVSAVDSDYAAVTYLGGAVGHPNLVTVFRLPGNRTVYHSPSPEEANGKRRGHPTWYGKRMKLKKQTDWNPADDAVEIPFTTAKGKQYKASIECWHNMLMTGKRDVPMHKYPFTLVRVRILNEEGDPVFRRPMWLSAIGNRRDELSLSDIYHAYMRRYDIEHFFRFGKQRLLMNSFQTPDTAQEQNWWTLVMIAYFQLWLGRYEANDMPRPWQIYLPEFKSKADDQKSTVSSPSSVQKDFGRIIRQFGTPAQPPKRRGYSPGRGQGQSVGNRTRHPVIKKGARAP